MVAGCTTTLVIDDRFPVSAIAVDSTSLTVWVAETPEIRAQGLKDLDALPQGIEGMLFSWEGPGLRSFHMRDTLFPLDIWWFDAEGALLGSTPMTPCPEVPCPSYPSPAGVRWALETPAGEYSFPVGSVLASDA